MCEYFGCGYCVLPTINMLCHVEVMFFFLMFIALKFVVQRYTWIQE